MNNRLKANIELLHADGPISPEVLLNLALSWGADKMLIIATDEEGRLMLGSTTDSLDKVVALSERAKSFLINQYP